MEFFKELVMVIFREGSLIEVKLFLLLLVLVNKWDYDFIERKYIVVKGRREVFLGFFLRKRIDEITWIIWWK